MAEIFLGTIKDLGKYWRGDTSQVEKKTISIEQLKEMGINLEIEEPEQGIVTVRANPVLDFGKALTAKDDKVGSAVEYFDWSRIKSPDDPITLTAGPGQHVTLKLIKGSGEDRIQIYPSKSGE